MICFTFCAISDMFFLFKDLKISAKKEIYGNIVKLF